MYQQKRSQLPNSASAPCLCNPEPYPLQHIPWDPLGPMRIRRIQRRLARCYVGLGRVHPLGPLEDLPEHVQEKVDRDANVVRDETIDVKRLEDVKPVEEGDHEEEGKGKPGEVRLERRFENEGVAVDALGFEGLVELDIGDADRHPGEEVGNGDEILEPGENDGRAGRAGKEGEERDGGGNHDTVVRYTGFGALEKDLWGLAVLGKGVHVAGSSVEEGVCGGCG